MCPRWSVPGHGVAVCEAAKAGNWYEGGRASSGRVLPGEACVPLATVAHVRGRAGVGQAEGLEQQERRMAPEWASGEMLV